MLVENNVPEELISKCQLLHDDVVDATKGCQTLRDTVRRTSQVENNHEALIEWGFTQQILQLIDGTANLRPSPGTTLSIEDDTGDGQVWIQAF